MIKKLLAIAFCAFCGGCSLAPLIDSDIVDYNKAVSDSGNRLLLLNVLRARDRAPLLFSSVQLVHGALQAGGSTSLTVPFSNPPIRNNDTWGVTMSTQVAPTFDVTSLDTQDFTRGILQPIDPQVVKYFLDRGDLDSKIILLLFFSELEDSRGNVIRIDPAANISISGALKSLVSGKVVGSRFIANAYTELTPVGPDYAEEKLALRDITATDPAKFRLMPNPDAPGTYRLYSIGQTRKVAFCLNVQTGNTSRFIGLGNIFSEDAARISEEDPRCTDDEYIVKRDARSHPETHGYEKITTRSVEGMVQFLGAVLRWEDAHGRPMTFNDFITSSEEGVAAPALFGANTSDIFFRAGESRADAMFSVNHLGRDYSVAPAQDATNVPDHTSEILALVLKLLDMNKSAKDLPVTQSVQIVP